MKLTWLPLLMSVLVAHQASAQVTKKTTTPKPLPCNKAKFKELMTQCCDTPMGILAANEFLEGCMTCTGVKDAESIEWISYYKLNVLMSAANKTIFTTKENKAVLCKVAPFINCLFKQYNMQFHGLFYGEEASQVILKTDPNRDESYVYYATDMLTEDTGYYADGYIPPKWNVSIDCPAKVNGKATTKPIWLGNVFLTQYYLTNIYYQCSNPKNDTMCTFKWDRFWNCHSEAENDFWQDQTIKIPQRLAELKAKNLKRAQFFQAKFRQLL